MKKRKIIDISTEEKRKEILKKFDEFTSKNQAHKYFGISDNKQGSEYLALIANKVGFDLNVYKERRKKKPTRYCKECGKEITSKWGKDFCCKSCSTKYNNEHRDKSIYRKEKHTVCTPKERYCIICGKKLEGSQRKYCSESCRNRNKYLTEGYDVVCQYCGKYSRVEIQIGNSVQMNAR
jgi:predicted nucleic acid-binding Zn ribbon protein